MNVNTPELFLVVRQFIEAENNIRNNLLFNSISRLPLNILRIIIEIMSNGEIFKIKNYYEEVIPNQNPSTFKSHFRVSLVQFDFIVNVVGNSPRFRKRDPQYGGREQICPEKAILITLWTLATPDSYRSVGDRFNVAKSTVYYAINTVIAVLLHDLAPAFITWPRENERMAIANAFARHGLPFVIGAIDGCHIPINKPREHGADYFNRKQFYSLVLQAICTSDLRFIDCDVRWPGSVHDGRVLRTSDVYRVAHQLCEPHFYIIGDAAYPCKTWLMSPFRNNGHLTPDQIYYNNQLSKTRVVIENAFALLKGRFRRLKDLLVRKHMGDYVNTIVASCVIHNICLIVGEEDLQAYIEEGRDHDNHIPMIADNFNDVNDEGVAIRNNLVRYLWNRRQQLPE